MNYGDILEYPRAAPGEDLIWRFMYLGEDTRFTVSYSRVLVLVVDPDDDLWVPGYTILTAGLYEMRIAEDV